MSETLDYLQIRNNNTEFLIPAITTEMLQAPPKKQKVLSTALKGIVVLEIVGNLLPANDPLAVNLERQRLNTLYAFDKERLEQELNAAFEHLGASLF